MALKNFTQFTPQTVLSATDFVVGYRNVDEIRTDLDSLTVAISGLLIAKGFTPGGSVGTVKRINYRYTIDGGENLNAVSGMDDYGNYLSYTTGQLDVYRNGVHLVDNQDFIANNSTQIRNLSTMNEGDVVDVVTLSATGVTITNLLSGGGTVFQTNYRYTCPTIVAPGTINITGPDDSGNTLLYSSPTLDVYLNGSHLVNGLDYSASNGSTITLSEGLSSGDILDVATLSAYDIGGLGGVSRIVAGPGIILNPSSGLGEVTITGNTLQLTGGNINIPVGSARNFTNLQSAIHSLTSYIFEDTANVQILLDDENFNETNTIDLSLDYGDRLTIKGQGDYNFKSTIGSPVFSVSGVNTSTLSATILLNASSHVPAVGDYVNIYSVSGRDASYINSLRIFNTSFLVTQDIAGQTNGASPLRSGESNNYISVGDKVLVTILTGGNDTTTTMSQVYTISSINGNYTAEGYYRNQYNFASQASIFPSFAGNYNRNIVIQSGNPQSHIGNTFTQLSAAGPHVTNPVFNANYILTFSDATATNTYLNPGDQILALGQTRFVEAVSSNNTCFLDFPFKTGRKGLSGYNIFDGYSITTNTPYLVKTFYERYRGCHRVAAVNGTTSITIEIPDYGFFKSGMAGSGSSLQIISGLPLPRYGVESIGNPITYVNQINGTSIASPQSKILKTKLNFSNINSTALYPVLSAGFPCLYLNGGKIYNIDNLVVVNEGITKARGIDIGFGVGELNASSSISIGNSGLGIVGKFRNHIRVNNNSIADIVNVGAQVYVPNYDQFPHTGVAHALPGQTTVIYYVQGAVGNINYLVAIGSSIGTYAGVGNVQYYTAISAGIDNSINCSALSNNFYILLHRRVSGYSETIMRMSIPDGGGSLTKCSMFSNNGKGAHRSFGWNGYANWSNFVGLGNNIETLGGATYSNIICDSIIVGSRAVDENLANCNFSFIQIQGIYGNTIINKNTDAGAIWSNFYFCDTVVNWDTQNNRIDFRSGASFANCIGLFSFTSSFCSIFAAGCKFSNCVTRDSGAPVVFIDTATGNQYSPPTELPGGF